MKSIMQDEQACKICGSTSGLEEHHIFGGPNRINSEKYGLKVYLCYRHHRGTCGVHGRDGADLQDKLHRLGQRKFEETHSREEFMEIFGKSYL